MEVIKKNKNAHIGLFKIMSTLPNVPSTVRLQMDGQSGTTSASGRTVRLQMDGQAG